jgi:hypothetical protein
VDPEIYKQPLYRQIRFLCYALHDLTTPLENITEVGTFLTGNPHKQIEGWLAENSNARLYVTTFEQESHHPTFEVVLSLSLTDSEYFDIAKLNEDFERDIKALSSAYRRAGLLAWNYGCHNLLNDILRTCPETKKTSS